MDKKQPTVENNEKLVKLEEEISHHITELTSANKRLKRKIFDLYTIFEISRHLNTVLDTESLLDGIILTIIGQMGVGGCAIFTIDSQDKGLVLAKSKGLTLDSDKNYYIPSESTLFQATADSPNMTYNITELAGIAPDAVADIELLKSFDSELVIPMSLKNKLRGLLIVTEKISLTPFYEDDKDFLIILANQLSVAVENARLFESEKEAYNQLSQAQKQLVETEKLAALGQLSARVAHEVNNPLGIIKNYLELILRSTGKTEEIPNYVSILKEEVDRIAGIVRQLLDFYHPHAIQKKEVELSKILDEIIVLVSVQLKSQAVELKKEYSPELPPVWASSEQLKQVFLNMIMNARDFMPDGGEIIVSSDVEDGYVIITFADSGTGISEDSITKVFEPFFTTKNGSSGTGLGLSVCYGIIQNHGGILSVNNREEGGAKFTIKLPVYYDKN
jgi:signal transduction histidine kinase